MRPRTGSSVFQNEKNPGGCAKVGSREMILNTGGSFDASSFLVFFGKFGANLYKTVRAAKFGASAKSIAPARFRDNSFVIRQR